MQASQRRLRPFLPGSWISVWALTKGIPASSESAKSKNLKSPMHKARNTIFVDGIKVDQAFVIDVTGSMQGEINGVIKALKEAIAEIDDSSNAPLMALVTFRDEEEVELQALTNDMDALVGAIEKLKATRGGTCNEASAEALNLVIPHVKKGGSILFATDASPYPDADVNAIIDQLRDSGIRLNAMITGDCSMQDSWNELSN